MHRLGIFLASCACAVLAVTGPANACGIWYLADHAAKREGVFEVVAVRVAPPPPDPTDRRSHAEATTVALINNPDGAATCSFGGRNATIRDDGAFVGRRKVAKVDGAHWSVGGKDYEVSITPVAHGHPTLRWHVAIKRKGTLVAEGDAMSFACDGGSNEARGDRNVAQHLMCYMLAREQGFKKFSK